LTPLHATSSGKILLAYRSEKRRTELLSHGMRPYTQHTVTTRRELTAQLATVHERGYAVAVEEYEIGLNAIAAPIRGHDGKVFAAVSASGPAYRLTEILMHEQAALLVHGADEISRRLGYLG
jgi:DNA-binding IclR family transcriptional regulator